MSTARPTEPTSLRSYRLIAEIGRGGMANVYLAVVRGQAGFNKLVVVKKTRSDVAIEGDAQAMFLDEARIAARMNHPNVVQTYEFGDDDGSYFIAMEYLDGQAYSRIASRLRAMGNPAGVPQAPPADLPLVLHARIVADALAGLHHAHELRDFDGTPLGVVHRDATPHNVFVTYDGSIKVVDFGIAKALDAAARTTTGVVKGKVSFMSPEQARGEPLDRRTDVFSAGVMLWEAIAGRRMWEMPELSIVHELMYDRVPSLEAVAPGAPAPLLRVVSRALAPRRDDRYPTALEMSRDLEAWIAGTGARATARDVGERIAPAFEVERGRVRAVIESQLADLRWTGEQARVTDLDLPSLDLPPGALDVREPLPLPQAPGAGTTAFMPTDSAASVPVPSQRPVTRSLLVPAVVAALASIAVLLVGIRILVRPSQAASSAPATTSAEPPRPAETAAATVPAPAVPEAVTLTVRGAPADARIYLDGVLLSAGPFEGRVMRSTKTRVVRVEAAGYQPKDEEITLGGDVVVAYELAKVEAPKPQGGARPDRPKPKHDIDEGSPYHR